MSADPSINTVQLPPSAPSTPLAPVGRPGLYRRLVTSQHPFPKFLRRVYRGVNSFSLPAPRIIVQPLTRIFVLSRAAYHFVLRVFICEPFFKAHCAKYGRGVHTGCYLHWFNGRGDILVGDNVTVDGKCSITFAARFSDRPVLEIGDNTGIGHECSFAVGKRITLGRNCVLSGSVHIMDSNGHPSDPSQRLELRAPDPQDVRPVTIGDNVWIGRQSIIFPGVKIGQGSVISAGSIVRSHVPPYSVVAGNPAKVMFRLKKSDSPPVLQQKPQ